MQLRTGNDVGQKVPNNHLLYQNTNFYMLTIMHWQEQSAFFSFMYALMGTYLYFAVLSKTRAKMQYFINTNLMIPTLWRNPLWALHQRHFSEYRTLHMINKDQLYHLTHCLHPYMCFSFHCDFIHHKCQMMPSVTNMDMKQQNNYGHCSNGLYVNTGQGV